MIDEGFAKLACASAKMRNEHRLLLEELRSFERKLLELVSGGWNGNARCDQYVLDSLIAKLLVNLYAESDKTALVVQSLAQFVKIEKADIDSDLDDFFNGDTKLVNSWMRGREAGESYTWCNPSKRRPCLHHGLIS